MEQNKEYFVFISYSSLDNEWAIWLRHELEHYHLPASFNGRTNVRNNLRKVFRDRDELSAGPEWDEQVQKALEDTNNLIVICSPHSAKSDAVNKEIETFIALGKEDHIFPFIVEGDKPEDCFPPALRHSKLGGDVNKDGGRDSAFIKVVAGMLKVSFPSLWNRYEIEKAEEERKIREQRDKLLIMQSRFLAEKANALVDEGDSYTARLLALEALPKDLENPDRPYTVEAEACLRKALNIPFYRFGHNEHVKNIKMVQCSPDGRYLITLYKDLEASMLSIWDSSNGKRIRTIGEKDPRYFGLAYSLRDYQFFSDLYQNQWHGSSDISYIAISNDGKYILSLSSSVIVINELISGRFIRKIYTDPLEKATFSIDGNYILGYAICEDVIVWDFKTGEQLDNNMNISVLPQGSTTILTSEYTFYANKLFGNISRDNGIKIYTHDGEHIAFSIGTDIFGIINSRYFYSLLTPIKQSILQNPLPEKDRGGNVSSPSQEIIATIHDSGYEKWIDIRYKNGKSGKIISELPFTENIETVLFSPNEKYLVCIPGKVYGQKAENYFHEIWDMDTMKFLCKIEGQRLADDCLSFHPNSNSIALISDNNTIKVFDIHTGYMLVEYPFIADKHIKLVSFSEDGSMLYAQSTEGSTYSWKFENLQQLIDETIGRFKECELTSEERKKYYLD